MPKKSSPKKIPINPSDIASPEASAPKKVSSKKPSRGTRVNIQKITEQRLIDEKLRLASDADRRWSRIIAAAALTGFIAGIAVLAYYGFWKGSFGGVSEVYRPEITVPKQTESTPQPAPEPSSPASVPEAQVAKPKVEILDTPTGFLNVRSGPGTNFSKIGEATPGQLFDFVSENQAKAWYELRLTATSTGWVTKQYSKIVE